MANFVNTVQKYINNSTINDSNKLFNDVVSNFQIDSLHEHIEYKIIELSNLEKYHKEGYFLFKNEFGDICIAIKSLKIFNVDIIKNFSKKQIFMVNKVTFQSILLRNSSEFNINQAINSLDNSEKFYSAKSINYNKMVCGFYIIFFFFIYTSVNIFNLLNNILYFVQNLLKSVLFTSAVLNSTKEITITRNNLPTYSILVPLYKEEFKTESILKSMKNLDYPKDKLDIKFIVEDGDITTLQSLLILEIPSYIEIIKVPFSLPQTKPKALNYAMPFVVGEYLTIYDAEDEPEPQQLLKSIALFRNLPEEYVCVQARLNFYNASSNLLTRLFSIEYSVWFNYLLKGLSNLDLPLPLGGTSNHFKVSKLKEVGLWDAYNVTEDADLGIRLYSQGYKVCMLDSITMEEAPTNIKDWIFQRSRWIKGFAQTIAVFMKRKTQSGTLSFKQVAIIYIFVGLSTYSFVFLPWLMILLFVNLASYIYFLWFINSLFAIIYMQVVAYKVISDKNNFIKFKSWKDYLAFFIWPFYFILHSIAAYIAIWEIIKSPFKWNKTPHGTIKKNFQV